MAAVEEQIDSRCVVVRSDGTAYGSSVEVPPDALIESVRVFTDSDSGRRKCSVTYYTCQVEWNGPADEPEEWQA